MIKEIQSLLGTDKLLLGQDRTMKALRNGSIKKIFLASNASTTLKEDVDYYKSVSDFDVEVLKENSEEMGTICKKSFSISVIGVLK